MLPCNPAISLLGHFPERVENLCSHLNLHMGVYSNFTHNCRNLEAAKMSFGKGKDTSAVVHPGNGVLVSPEQYYNELSNHEKTRRDLKCILLSQSEKATCWVIPTMEILKKRRMGAARGWGWRKGRAGRAQWHCSVCCCGDERLSFRIRPNLWNAEHRQRALKQTGGFGCWRWVHMGLMIVTNMPLWWGTVVTGGEHARVGGGTWDISVPSSQFCCELKTDRK